MRIDNLSVGTKLMWDAPPIGDWYNNGQRIVYPALVIEKNKYNPAITVKILTGHKANWMGPEEDNLRLPTEEELATLTWPMHEHLNY